MTQRLTAVPTLIVVVILTDANRSDLSAGTSTGAAGPTGARTLHNNGHKTVIFKRRTNPVNCYSLLSNPALFCSSASPKTKASLSLVRLCTMLFARLTLFSGYLRLRLSNQAFKFIQCDRDKQCFTTGC